MPDLFKILVLLCLFSIVVSLFSGLFFMMKDTGSSTRTVKALTIRVALSVTLFTLLLVGYAAGFFGSQQSPVVQEQVK